MNPPTAPSSVLELTGNEGSLLKWEPCALLFRGVGGVIRVYCPFFSDHTISRWPFFLMNVVFQAFVFFPRPCDPSRFGHPRNSTDPPST